MDNTALIIFGVLITLLISGGVTFTILEFKRMHSDQPKKPVAPEPPKRQKTRHPEDEY